MNNNESAGSHPHSVRPMEKRIEIPPPLVPVQIPEVAVQVEKIWLCQNCTHPIRGGEVAIFAERAGSDKCWHPDCFSCSICHVSISYFESYLSLYQFLLQREHLVGYFDGRWRWRPLPRKCLTLQLRGERTNNTNVA